MRDRYLKAFEKMFTSKLRSPVTGDTEYWRAVIEASGSTLLSTIKIRQYTRGVFIIQHPSYGKCILKTSSPVRNSGKGFANMAIAQIIAESNQGIFPKIYESSPSFTLEEYIEGPNFKTWKKEDYDPSVAKCYFTELKNWSENCTEYKGNDYLTADEIRILCNYYIKKCIRHMRYISPAKSPKLLFNFYKQKNSLILQSEWLWRAAKNLRLPKGMMCGDMNVANIIVDLKSSRLYNIDYEYLSVGHHGFDTVYFISSMFKKEFSVSFFDQLSELLLTDEFLGGELCGNYFRNLTKLLINIEKIVFSPDEVN